MNARTLWHTQNERFRYRIGQARLAKNVINPAARTRHIPPDVHICSFGAFGPTSWSSPCVPPRPTFTGPCPTRGAGVSSMSSTLTTTAGIQAPALLWKDMPNLRNTVTRDRDRDLRLIGTETRHKDPPVPPGFRGSRLTLR